MVIADISKFQTFYLSAQLHLRPQRASSAKLAEGADLPYSLAYSLGEVHAGRPEERERTEAALYL